VVGRRLVAELRDAADWSEVDGHPPFGRGIMVGDPIRDEIVAPALVVKIIRVQMENHPLAQAQPIGLQRPHR